MPSPQLIKQRIESLIEREYIAREAADHKLYNYVAWRDFSVRKGTLPIIQTVCDLSFNPCLLARSVHEDSSRAQSNYSKNKERRQMKNKFLHVSFICKQVSKRRTSHQVGPSVFLGLFHVWGGSFTKREVFACQISLIKFFMRKSPGCKEGLLIR